VIPKAELHCHLEGSVPPVLARELAARNGLELPHGLFGANGYYAWTDFLSFLDSYDRVCGVLRKPRDFGDILYSYLQRTAAEGAVYVEMFCSPERPKGLGIPYAAWLGALVDAIDRARSDFGIEARIVGICIFIAAFLLPACKFAGGRSELINLGTYSGWKCAWISLVLIIVPETYQSPFLLAVFGGLINPMIVAYLACYTPRFARTRRILSWAIFASISASSTFTPRARLSCASRV